MTYPLLIKSLLQTPIARHDGREIVYQDKRFSYTQFYGRVCQLAHTLTQMGVKPGDTVAVMDYDSNRYLECYFAVPMIGAVLHTINIRLSPEQILYTIDHAEDDVLLVHQDFLPLLEQIRGRIDTVKSYVLLREAGETPHTSVALLGEYEALLENHPTTFDFKDFDENTRATMFYTTGTTGMPKGVYFSHRQLVLHTLTTIATMSSASSQNFHQEDVYMPMTPMFHVHAWGFPYVATFMGVQQVYPGKYAPEHLLNLLVNERVTFSHCVPTILHMLMHAKGYDDANLSQWKVVIGGAALPQSMSKAALQKGIDIFTGYGMSETCPILTLAQLSPGMHTLPDDEQATLRAKTGLPMGLVDMKVVDEAMNPMPNHVPGELVVRAPWLTEGYFKDIKNSDALWRGGYLHTGDVGYKDDAGFFKITDRSKDIIKIGGEWVSSLELEDIIAQHASVKEVAVIGISDTKWGERPLALVVSKAPEEHLEKSLLHHTKEYIKKGIMAREGMLVKIEFVDAIDKTSVGKIDKKALRARHGATKD
jgi:fatty-acyl-CoA synthase